MKPHAILLIFTFIFSGCDDLAPPPQAPTNKAIKNAENHNLLTKFTKQKHKLRLNGCELTYNLKRFNVGDTEKELVNVFGDNFIKEGVFNIWKEAGIAIAFHNKFDPTKPSTSIQFVFDETLNSSISQHKKKDIFLIEGIPLFQGFTMKELTENSTYTFDSFTTTEYSYRLNFECQNNRTITYIFLTDGIWNYSGYGHLRYKTTPNLDNKNPVKLLAIE